MAASPQDVRLLLTGVLVEYQTGEFDRGQVYLERLLEVMRLSSPETTIFPYRIAGHVVHPPANLFQRSTQARTSDGGYGGEWREFLRQRGR